MSLTFHDVADRLKQIDELTLVEMLGLTSEDLVNRFSDVIEEKLEILTKEVDWN